MSATRDKSQKFSFVYSNLYQIYRQGADAAKRAQVPADSPIDASEFVVHAKGAPLSGNVLKTTDARAHAHAEPVVRTETVAPREISDYNPPSLLGKRLARKPEALREQLPAAVVAPRRESGNEALDSLKKNLQALNDLHSRLRFMLQELEDLVKE